MTMLSNSRTFPGHPPNNLTVAKIRTGNSIIRNPILVSYIAKGMLPYRGLGSGIKRALEDWPEIDFIIEQVTFPVVNLFQIRVVGHRFDLFLQGGNLIVARHHDDRAEFQALGQVHRADRDIAAGRFNVLVKHLELESSIFDHRAPDPVPLPE